MKNLQKYNPLALDNYFDTAIESFLSPFLKMENDNSYGWSGPCIDRKQTGTGLEIKFMVPGYGKEDLEVTMQEGIVYVKGDGIELATNVPHQHKYDLGQVQATCEKGILTISAPYKEEEKGKAVEIT